MLPFFQVVAQAKADTGLANWMALELRHDRVHQIFSRCLPEAVISRQPLFCVLCTFALWRAAAQLHLYPVRLEPCSSQAQEAWQRPPNRTLQDFWPK